MSRIAAFVSAARSLLVVQVLAALLAIGVAGWAFFEVRGLVAEREQLRARVNQLETERGQQAQQPVAAVPLVDDPLINEVLPPEVLVPPEVTDALPEGGNVQIPVTPTVDAAPGNTVAPPGRWDQRPPTTTRPPETTRPQLDCAGADRNRPGCRPLPERPPIQQLPDRLSPRGEPLAPQQQTPQTRPPTETRPQATRPIAQPQTRPQLQVRPTAVRPQTQTSPQPQTRPTLTRPTLTRPRPRPQTEPPQSAPQQPSSTPPRSVIIS